MDEAPPQPADEIIPPTADGPPDWMINFLTWVAKDPWEFVTTVFLFLSPFFLISAVLAYKLSKQIEAKEKEKRKVSRRDKNLKNLRRAKID